MKEEGSKVSGGISPAIKALLVFVVIFLLPIIIVFGTLYFLWGFILTASIWIVWGLQGRHILFVYSNSPIWSGYIEQGILPQIREKAFILNWSERKTWKPSLAVWVFHYFGGRRNFNPMAIVFRPFQKNEEFRFYEAFKEFKHGNNHSLTDIKNKFFDAIRRD